MLGRRRRLRNKAIPKYISMTLIISFSLLAMLLWFEHTLKPSFFAVAETRVQSIATTAINNAIRNMVVSNNSYRDLINVKYDKNGRVVLVQPNTLEVNHLASATTLAIQKSIKDLTKEKVKVPIGQLSGSEILAGFGPKINVRIYPIGTAQVDIVDTFEQAGINQTRYRIYLETKTKIRIIIPLEVKAVEVCVKAPIAETVIVGEVPGTFMQAPTEFWNNWED